MQKYHPEAWAYFQEFKQTFLVHTLEDLLTKGINQGYVRADIDVKIMAKMRVSQVEMGFNINLFPLAEFSPWKVQCQFLEHFSYGICTLKGYKLLNQHRNILED
jgi:hypothetical protein